MQVLRGLEERSVVDRCTKTERMVGIRWTDRVSQGGIARRVTEPL